jgi:hypothetical protein
VTRLRVGIIAVLACLGALALTPSAFAHHGRISGSMNCDGTVTYTASAWQTSNTLAKTHNDVRIYVTQANGVAVSPAQQAGSGQFKSSNGFAFSGSFTVPTTVSSVRLLVKEIGPWGNGQSSSNGYHSESSVTISRPTSGCTPPPTDVCPNLPGNQATVPAGLIKDASGNCVTPPPPTDECPNIQGNQATVPAGLIKDASGNCVTPPPPPTDECPNLEGLQTSVPAGMIKDASGNCATPPPPPTDECPNLDGLQTSVPSGMLKDSSGSCFSPPPPEATPASLPGATVTPAAPKPAVKPAPKAKVKAKKKAKKTVVKKKAVKKKLKKQSTAKKTKPRALPFTP